jgi:hypothetical protein
MKNGITPYHRTPERCAVKQIAMDMLNIKPIEHAGVRRHPVKCADRKSASDKFSDQIRSDEAGRSRNKNGFHVCVLLNSRLNSRRLKSTDSF